MKHGYDINSQIYNTDASFCYLDILWNVTIWCILRWSIQNAWFLIMYFFPTHWSSKQLNSFLVNAIPTRSRLQWSKPIYLQKHFLRILIFCFWITKRDFEKQNHLKIFTRFLGRIFSWNDVQNMKIERNAFLDICLKNHLQKTGLVYV